MTSVGDISRYSRLKCNANRGHSACGAMYYIGEKADTTTAEISNARQLTPIQS